MTIQNQADDAGYSAIDKSNDIKVLHDMGYAQELERRMSRFSNFAISFSIICILSGGINSLAQATSGAGAAAIGIGGSAATSKWLGLLAVVLASINIFGGFAVTQRMLAMYKKKERPAAVAKH